MKGFFSVEGAFFTVTGKICDMVVITVLWAVGCIPVVTFFTSTASMYHTTVKCIRYDRGKVFEEFKDAYKKNLKQGIPLGILYGAAGGVIAAGDHYVLGLAASGTGAGVFPAAVMLLVSFLYAENLIWMIPVFSRFSDSFGNILRLDYVISSRYILRGVPMLLIIAAGALLIWISIPLVIIVPSLSALALFYLSEPGMHKYMPAEPEDSGDWRYGRR